MLTKVAARLRVAWGAISPSREGEARRGEARRGEARRRGPGAPVFFLIEEIDLRKIGMLVGAVVAVALVVAAALVGYVWFSVGSGGASVPISAPVLPALSSETLAEGGGD